MDPAEGMVGHAELAGASETITVSPSSPCSPTAAQSAASVATLTGSGRILS